jgi:hypothetical protein
MKRELGPFEHNKKAVHDAIARQTEKQRTLHHVQQEFEYHWNPTVEDAISSLKIGKSVYEQLKGEAAQVGSTDCCKRTVASVNMQGLQIAILGEQVKPHATLIEMSYASDGNQSSR